MTDDMWNLACTCNEVLDELGIQCNACNAIDEIIRLRALCDQLAEALRCTHGLDMTHLDRVKAHNMAVRALAAYEAAHKEADQPMTLAEAINTLTVHK